MIATPMDKIDIWAELSAPLPPSAIQWRQQGRPVSRDGRHLARFVAYIDSQFVQERLDSIVPGEWDSHLDQLPNVVSMDGEEDQEPYAFKCRLQILGVIREDVGTGRDYKTAATDAFKRAAVRFGIGRELYAMQPHFVQMDGDGKYGRQRPTTANSSNGESVHEQQSGSNETEAESQARQAREPLTSDEPTCPKCGGRLWDNRATKRNPKAPDYKCRDRACDGVIWPPKPTRRQPAEEEVEIPY
jgi:hypothetical protein